MSPYSASYSAEYGMRNMALFSSIFRIFRRPPIGGRNSGKRTGLAEHGDPVGSHGIAHECLKRR